MRNPEMTKQRDKKMVEMFYHMYDVKRVRLEDVLSHMSRKVFYLDTTYIYKRIFYISTNLAYYELLKNSKKRVEVSSLQMSLGF